MLMATRFIAVLRTQYSDWIESTVYITSRRDLAHKKHGGPKIDYSLIAGKNDIVFAYVKYVLGDLHERIAYTGCLQKISRLIKDKWGNLSGAIELVL